MVHLPYTGQIPSALDLDFFNWKLTVTLIFFSFKKLKNWSRFNFKSTLSEAHLQASKWVKLDQFELKYIELHDLARPISEFMKQVSI